MQSDSIFEIEGALRRVLETHNQTPWLDSEGAAAYLGCSAGTLKTWRSRGEGPRYHVIQNKLVRYHVDDLDAFVRGEVAR
ncbi:MAG: helix-turn-helix domain-containing protein [Sphingopyxis sp.]|nr:helix-turn-helix domain-containing protein [Sphingopyxis sp.]